MEEPNEKIFMSKGGARPEFNWTPDSKNVIFYSDDYMKNFNIETRTLTKRPIIHSTGIHLLEDGKTFLATNKANGYRLHSFDGSLIEKVQIPGIGMSYRNYLSADFKHLVFGYGDQLYIFDIINKKMVFQSQNKHQAHDNCSTLIPDTNKLFYRGAWGEHFTVDIYDPTKIEPIDAPPIIPMCTTQVINYPAK